MVYEVSVNSPLLSFSEWDMKVLDWAINSFSAPENYAGASKYTSTTPRAVVANGQTTCTIDKIVLQGPA